MGTSATRPAAKAVTGKRRVLVTGGSGFIGQHLVAALRDRGDIVRVLDLQRPPRQSSSEFIQGSILDRERVRRAMSGVQAVYHLAAIPHLWTLNRDDFERVNYQGTLTVLSVAAEMRVPRFVHCSTEAILFPPAGRGVDTPMRVEDMAGPYTRSKFLAERAALEAAHDGLSLVIVNPTVPIGPGDYNFTAPTAMLSQFAHRTPLLVLDCTLNLVDVRDAARGIVLAGERGRTGERYILGGENVTIRELVRQIGTMCGHRTSTFSIPGFAALAAASVAEWFATNVSHRRPPASAEAVRVALRSIPLDIDKAQKELGYTPHAINRALIDAVAWLSAVPAESAARGAVELGHARSQELAE